MAQRRQQRERHDKKQQGEPDDNGPERLHYSDEKESKKKEAKERSGKRKGRQGGEWKSGGMRRSESRAYSASAVAVH
jgi:hypothetical protein